MKQYSILLVDDEQIILETLGLDLKEEGYDLTEVRSGYDAIEKLKKRNYDLVITDLIMDGVGGIDVLKEAKSKNREANVMIISSRGTFASAVDALRLGASDYILKPWDRSDMLMRVSSCFEKLEFKRNAMVFQKLQRVDDNKIPLLHSVEYDSSIKRLFVYSHDTFGLGNIRRMLAVCHYLLDSFPHLSILFVSGSPMIHGFRIPDRMDYIKLPCLSRDENESFSVKYLKTDIDEMMKLRSDLILTTLAVFRPHLLLIDKKPYGVTNELQNALVYLKTHLPDTKMILVLRDILDNPDVTIKVWKKNKYFEAIQSFYNLVLILGQSNVFNASEEYRFPSYVSQKVRYCGYVKRNTSRKNENVVKEELKIGDNEKLILVTPGGGEDGYYLIKTYLQGLKYMPDDQKIKGLIVCGPGMDKSKRKEIYHVARMSPNVMMLEFTSDMMIYMNAADIIVSMGGYNTICEILSLKKKAIIVPRVDPVEEQWIRAKRMAQFGLFRTIHPNCLTPQGLTHAILDELNPEIDRYTPFEKIDFRGLQEISRHVLDLLQTKTDCDDEAQILERKIQ